MRGQDLLPEDFTALPTSVTGAIFQKIFIHILKDFSSTWSTSPHTYTHTNKNVVQNLPFSQTKIYY